MTPKQQSDTPITDALADDLMMRFLSGEKLTQGDISNAAFELARKLESKLKSIKSSTPDNDDVRMHEIQLDAFKTGAEWALKRHATIAMAQYAQDEIDSMTQLPGSLVTTTAQKYLNNQNLNPTTQCPSTNKPSDT
jgi:hypothetical protein